MSYSKFSLNQLASEFGIEQQRASLFTAASIKSITPSPTLLELITDAQGAPLGTEIAISMGIIYPIFNEIRRKNNTRMTLFSGYTLKVDTAKKLTGACDFLLSLLPDLFELRAPIFCLVEAKKGVIESGLGQCGAEMYAAQLYNTRDGFELPTVFGCVTNGSDWVFLRLDGKRLLIDKIPYQLSDLPTILGVLQHIIDFYEPYRTAIATAAIAER